LFGAEEQFMPRAGIPYFPHPLSFLVDRGTVDIPAAVKYMPMQYGGGARRPYDGKIDIGAYELPKR